MRLRGILFLTVVAVLAILEAAPPAPAREDVAATKATRELTVQQWVVVKADPVAAAAGADWLDLSVATAYAGSPGSVLRTLRDHPLTRWGECDGARPAQCVANDYASLVAALRAGDATRANQWFGVLARNFVFVCDPLNTGSCRAETARLHVRYERRLMLLVNRRSTNPLQSATNGIRPVGIHTSVATFTIKAAKKAHRDYAKLVRSYARQGFSRPVTLISRRALKRAAQGVASIIVQAGKDAGYDPSPAPTPTVSPTATPTPSPDPTPTVTPTPTPSPTPTAAPTPTQGTVVNVPSSASKSQIDACMAQARADGPGTSVVFPAGRFAYAGTLVVPDYINLSGQGIWDQGVADGAGGTWLQCPIKWGSYSTISKLLLGFNSAGQACTFTPCPAGSSACGSYTQAHGSTGCTFSLVRFKGGADAGANLFYTANYGVGWSTATDPVKRDSLIDTTFEDCEFERPQATNSVGVTSMFKGGNPGSIMCLWIDSRAGGGDITGNRWIRCHFGVKNGYHSGVDGYGIGTTFLIQPGPDGPGKTSDPADNGDSYSSAPTRAANWNPDFDWNQITHTASDNSFVDCLFEYACWVSHGPLRLGRQLLGLDGHLRLRPRSQRPEARRRRRRGGLGRQPGFAVGQHPQQVLGQRP